MTEIEKFKHDHGRIYRLNVLGIEYIFRPLRMSEYRLISQQEDPEEKERIILTSGILSPVITSLTQLPSGVAESLILAISDSTDINENTILQKVQQKRDELGMSDDYLKWKCHIIKNLNYKPEEVDAMNFDQFIEALVLAEEILGAPLVVVGTEEEELPQQEECTTDQPSPIDLDNMGQLGQVADNTRDDLRKVYDAGKKLRRHSGGRS